MASPPGPRYHNRRRFFNSYPEYSEILDKRDKFGIEQYATPQFQRANYFELATLDSINHIWTFGDRFYKLAYKYYNNSTVWWIIAFLNQKPTESHCTLGEEITIYLPLRSVLLQLGVY